jgi:hypothetical protein
MKRDLCMNHLSVFGVSRKGFKMIKKARFNHASQQIMFRFESYKANNHCFCQSPSERFDKLFKETDLKGE